MVRGFFLYLLSALTPLSRDRLRGACNISSIILPNLSLLKVGSGPAIDMADKRGSSGTLSVGCLAAGRSAAHAGRSKKEIIAASNGFFHSSSNAPTASSPNLGVTARLKITDLHFTLGGDPDSMKYCRANFQNNLSYDSMA